MISNDTIVALATPTDAFAIAVMRISGKEAIAIANQVFKSIRNKDLAKQKSHTLHLGHIVDPLISSGQGEKIIVQVLVAIFKGPNS